MPTRQELKKIAEMRFREAEALFAAGHYNGAAYLCGYAVEMALKARICRLLGFEVYPEGGSLRPAFVVHDLKQLLLLSGLRAKLYDSTVFANWSTAHPWSPRLRYEPPGAISRGEAAELLKAVGDPQDGVLQWIKRYW